MKINAGAYFPGAYQSRLDARPRPEIKISDESRRESELHLQRALKRAIQENPDFFGSKLGDPNAIHISTDTVELTCSYHSVALYGQEMYKQLYESRKEEAAGREIEDEFWLNDHDQWVTFSKYLYENGFYEQMSDSEVYEFEKKLCQITDGMNQVQSVHSINSFYNFGSIFRTKNFGMDLSLSKAEMIAIQESSICALEYLSDHFIPASLKDGFDQLIQRYRKHNDEIIAIPAFSEDARNHELVRMKKNYESCGYLPARSDWDEYAIMQGNLSITQRDYQDFRNFLAKTLHSVTSHEDLQTKMKDIKAKYLDLATGNSKREDFRDDIWNHSKNIFLQIENYYSFLLPSNRPSQQVEKSSPSRL